MADRASDCISNLHFQSVRSFWEWQLLGSDECTGFVARFTEGAGDEALIVDSKRDAGLRDFIDRLKSSSEFSEAEESNVMIIATAVADTFGAGCGEGRRSNQPDLRVDLRYNGESGRLPEVALSEFFDHTDLSSQAKVCLRALLFKHCSDSLNICKGVLAVGRDGSMARNIVYISGSTYLVDFSSDPVQLCKDKVAGELVDHWHFLADCEQDDERTVKLPCSDIEVWSSSERCWLPAHSLAVSLEGCQSPRSMLRDVVSSLAKGVSSSSSPQLIVEYKRGQLRCRKTLPANTKKLRNAKTIVDHADEAHPATLK
eukprot:TRINITY_DN42371_c0_g1_i1.p1 TRINITY_DN42371_c0_g1~~TRINITY_DN42371_c0_g1_i1.p1  ORF type:complete len:314 (-),score=46.08 TRINITY_DN42371_c0_g1_i1:212-1153(-)